MLETNRPDEPEVVTADLPPVSSEPTISETEPIMVTPAASPPPAPKVRAESWPPCSGDSWSPVASASACSLTTTRMSVNPGTEVTATDLGRHDPDPSRRRRAGGCGRCGLAPFDGADRSRIRPRAPGSFTRMDTFSPPPMLSKAPTASSSASPTATRLRAWSSEPIPSTMSPSSSRHQ